MFLTSCFKMYIPNSPQQNWGVWLLGQINEMYKKSKEDFYEGHTEEP